MLSSFSRYKKNLLYILFYLHVIITIKISPEITISSLKFMCDKYNNLIKTYQRCASSSSYDDYLDSKELDLDIEECQLLKEMSLDNKKFYNELQRLKFYNVYKTFPKDMINDIIASDNSLKLRNETIIKCIKDYYSIVKKFFDKHKDEISYESDIYSNLSPDIKKALTLFAKECINLTADLLINIIYVLESLGDDTFTDDKVLIYSNKNKVKYHLFFFNYIYIVVS
ncbi:hypothetical protein NAPIS_ORF00332 [Vairimorpha apis BRL 01]|uniref:Uncharacterized protein n=1 Tax=Vairimorpha apis BRL 01 TaxID=1037528 RepID=T0L3M0_9MICR|nr:hypothetical protein NAPIS_ORF00332 [Vairimorpha apis BRL 01]